MNKLTTYPALKKIFLEDPEFRAIYEAESRCAEPDYQIVRHHDDGTEEVVFDSRRSENWCDYFADAEPADEDFLIERPDVITDRADLFDAEPENN